MDASDPLADTRTIEANPMQWQAPAMPMKCNNSLFDATTNVCLTIEDQQPQDNDSSCPEKTFPAKIETIIAIATATAQVLGHASEQSKNSDNSSTEILEITSSPKPTMLNPLLPPINATTTTTTTTLAPPAATATATEAALAAPTIRRPPSSRLVDSSWPQAMVSTHFFGTCATHQGQRKNELNFFCLGCGPSGGDGALMCQYCAQEHTTHCDGACIQLYRYMYHDIVRVAAVNHLIDLSGIQQYRANGHPAVHLRPMGPPANKSPYSSMCDGGCGRCLDPQWAYCSLSCKLGLAEQAATNNNYGVGNINTNNQNSAGGVIAYVTTNSGAFKNTGKLSAPSKHGSATNLAAGATASNSEEDEDFYYYNNYSNGLFKKWSSSSSSCYKRAMMVSRASLKGAKRRKSVYPVRSDSL